MSDHIHAFLSQWTTAEPVGDAETLATLLTDDFSGIGPLGFRPPPQGSPPRPGLTDTAENSAGTNADRKG
jgi:hypothetical protein